jgi:hemin uptake protein HemP
MDDLLRAYARKRRESAPPDAGMPPGARAHLQGEVRRTFGTDAPPRRAWEFRAGWWWKLALGGATVTAAVVILMARMRPLEPVTTLGMYRARQSVRREVNSPPRTITAPPTVESVPSRNAAPAETVAAAEPAVAAIAPPPAPTAALAIQTNAPSFAATVAPPERVESQSIPSHSMLATDASQARSNALSGEVAVRNDSFASAHAASKAVTLQDSAGTRAALIPRSSQASPAASVPPSSLVLNQFQIQRAGEKVVVLDNDGSVYRGKVTTNSTPAQLAFRVSGLNRMLAQKIVFTGAVSGGGTENSAPNWQRSFQNQLQTANLSNAAGPAQNRALFAAWSNRAQAPAASATQNNALPGAAWRVTGQVRIGSAKPIEVEAASSQP